MNICLTNHIIMGLSPDSTKHATPNECYYTLHDGQQMLYWVRAANQLAAHCHALSLTVEFWRQSQSRPLSHAQ